MTFLSALRSRASARRRERATTTTVADVGESGSFLFSPFHTNQNSRLAVRGRPYWLLSLLVVALLRHNSISDFPIEVPNVTATAPRESRQNLSPSSQRRQILFTQFGSMSLFPQRELPLNPRGWGNGILGSDQPASYRPIVCDPRMSKLYGKVLSFIIETKQ